MSNTEHTRGCLCVRCFRERPLPESVEPTVTVTLPDVEYELSEGAATQLRLASSYHDALQVFRLQAEHVKPRYKILVWKRLCKDAAHTQNHYGE